MQHSLNISLKIVLHAFREHVLITTYCKYRPCKHNFCLLFCRHSNFGGTYIMTNTKSLSDRELIYHKSIQDVQNFSLDMNKKPRKKPKNRQPITEKPVIRRSTLSIRLSLKEFCVQFLENAYNPLMYAVKVGTCILEKNCDGVLCCSKELYIYIMTSISVCTEWE